MPNGSEFRIGSDFYFDVNGLWPHPHTPRKWTFDNKDKSDSTKMESFLSFRTTAPAWTQLTSILIEEDTKKGGHTPAPVVTQFKQVFRRQPLDLMVGGYRNKQALILQRNHELFSLKSGWEKGLDHLNGIVNFGLGCKSILHSKLYGVGKSTGADGLVNQAVDQFYALSEPLIHHLLKKIEWNEAGQQISDAKNELMTLSETVFNAVLIPYEHESKRLKIIIKGRASLHDDLRKLKGFNKV